MNLFGKEVKDLHVPVSTKVVLGVLAILLVARIVHAIV